MYKPFIDYLFVLTATYSSEIFLRYFIIEVFTYNRANKMTRISYHSSPYSNGHMKSCVYNIQKSSVTMFRYSTSTNIYIETFVIDEHFIILSKCVVIKDVKWLDVAIKEKK